MKAIHIIQGSILTGAALTIAALYLNNGLPKVAAQGPVRFSGPTSSQPLALSADDALLIVANPDNNSVSLFDVQAGRNTRLAEIPVGNEPNGVAISPDGTVAYVANTVDGTVTILGINRAVPTYATTVLATVRVGTEPYGLALTPSGRKLYVTNSRSNSVSVIDTTTPTYPVSRTIANVGIEPRGIAITNGGGADASETVFVTQFLALPVSGRLDGADDAKVGRVTVISAATDTVTGTITLNPLANTGFQAAGDALKRIAPPAAPTPADFTFVTGAYPNQLNGIAIRGQFAFLPNTGASPNGPVRFDVNTQSLLSVINLTTRADAGKTINMHAAVRAQTSTTRRFLTVPWAMAFKYGADDGYVLSAASNVVVKVKIDATGAPTVQSDPTDTTRVLQIPTGKNPRGIVINSTDRTAYVMNYVSRDVTVLNLTGAVEAVTTTMQSASLPTAGTQADLVHVGKELYNTSVGQFDPPAAGQPAIAGRMSNNGWGSCSSCHPFGLTDNVVWIFPSGPRRTIPQHTDFDLSVADRTVQRVLNWTAERDEEEDFELNIRAVSGGQGLIVLADGIAQDPAVTNFTPLKSGGRNQLKVRGVGAWDGLKAYAQFGIRPPISPASKTDPDVVAGRQAFTQANCQSCHGGAQWTTSRVRFQPPPDASLIVATQLIAELRNVGTFDPAGANEVRANAAAPLGAQGFTPPSLLSLFAFPATFFHNGTADTLDAVMLNVVHRSAGTPGTDTLQDANRRRQLVAFLLSIDAATVPIAPNAPGTLTNVSAASYRGSPLALESDVTATGTGLATDSRGAESAQLPITLAGSTVSLNDSAGVLRLLPLFYASPGQVNYHIPPSVAAGAATVTVTAASGAVSTGPVQIVAVAPGIFTANSSGTGVPAATAIRVTPDGTQIPVAVFQCNSSGLNCTPAPINMGATGESVFVTFYGTGIRRRTALSSVTCSIGGVDAPVLFAGAQGEFVGLDQLNVQLPASLRGRGEVSVVFTVEGQTTNPVTIAIQ